MLIDRLTHLLIEHGYHFKVEPGYDAVFERNIEDGFQRIAARIGGEHPAFTCKLDIEQGSKFYTDAMARAGHVLGNPDGLQLIINEQLSFFRSLNHPGWLRLPGHVVNLIWTEGWLDWMLEDLRALVLPVLDEGRTAAGLFRLYTSTTWTNRFPAAIGLSGNARVESMSPALVAAAMASSREFEER